LEGSTILYCGIFKIKECVIGYKIPFSLLNNNIERYTLLMLVLEFVGEFKDRIK
jgi:hypothetical protein